MRRLFGQLFETAFPLFRFIGLHSRESSPGRFNPPLESLTDPYGWMLLYSPVPPATSRLSGVPLQQPWLTTCHVHLTSSDFCKLKIILERINETRNLASVHREAQQLEIAACQLQNAVEDVCFRYATARAAAHRGPIRSAFEEELAIPHRFEANDHFVDRYNTAFRIIDNPYSNANVSRPRPPSLRPRTETASAARSRSRSRSPRALGPVDLTETDRGDAEQMPPPPTPRHPMYRPHVDDPDIRRINCLLRMQASDVRNLTSQLRHNISERLRYAQAINDLNDAESAGPQS